MAFNFRQKRKGLFGSQGGWTPPIRAEQPDMGEMLPGMGMQQPEQRKPGLGTRLLGEGWEDKAFALGGLMQGDPRGAYMLQQRQDAAAQQAAQMAAEQRKRSTELADWKWKQDYTNANKPPEAPNLREDNAGNVWQFDPQTGQPMGDKPVWVDPTEKVIYQDGMQIRVPNPYRGGGTSTANANLPTVSDQASYDAVPAGSQYRDAKGNVRTKQGGPSQPATGNFPQPL